MITNSPVTTSSATQPPHEEPKRSDWWGVYATGAAAFILGSIGFAERHSTLEAMYLAVQLYVLQSGTVDPNPGVLVEVARWLAPISIAWGAIKGFLAISQERAQALSLRSYKGHAVVCGLGVKGRRIAAEFLARGLKVVIVEIDHSNDAVSEFRKKGAMVLIGNCSDTSLLKRVHVDTARYAVAVTADDGLNVETGKRVLDIRRNAAQGPGNFVCVIHVADSRIRTAMRNQGFLARLGSAAAPRFVSAYDNGARALCRSYAPDTVCPVQTSDAPAISVMIVGCGQFAIDLLLQLARTAHYLNGTKTIITMVDGHAGQVGKELLQRFPFLPNILELRCIDEAASLLNTQRMAQLTDETHLTICYLSLESEIVESAVYVQIYPFFEARKIPLVVCMQPQRGTTSLLESVVQQEEHRITHLFPIVEHACSYEVLVDEKLDVLAAEAHRFYLARERDAYAQKCARAREEGKPIPAAKSSMTEWENLDESYRIANRSLADHIDVKLRAIGCQRAPVGDSREPVDLTADRALLEHLGQMEHRRWCADRWLAGWHFGPTRNDQEKIHDNLVTWEQLTREVQEYDIDAVLDIPGILAAVGEKVVRAM